MYVEVPCDAYLRMHTFCDGVEIAACVLNLHKCKKGVNDLNTLFLEQRIWADFGPIVADAYGPIVKVEVWD